MCLIRKASTIQRKELYLAHRILDQKSWYAAKAAHSSKMENRLFVAVIIAQLLAVGLAIFSLMFLQGPSGVVGVITSLCSSTLAWLQVKKYQETAQAYSVTSLELGQVESLGRNVLTEENLAQFVEDAEAAISREHTLWIARRTAR